jgi:hypothetical protein
MKKIAGALAAAALAVGLLVAPAGAAGTKSGCRGKWTDGGVCSFTYKGGDITIQAEGSGGDPATVVSIQLEAPGPNGVGKVVLMSCGVAAGGNGAPAACGSTSTGGTTVPYEPKPGDELTCTVNGNGTGKFRCISGA